MSNNTREGQCYSCYNHTMFQLFGQTKDFFKTNHSQVYIDRYQKGLDVSAVIDCHTCGRKVEYQQQDSGQWTEFEIRTFHLDNAKNNCCSSCRTELTSENTSSMSEAAQMCQSCHTDLSPS